MEVQIVKSSAAAMNLWFYSVTRFWIMPVMSPVDHCLLNNFAMGYPKTGKP
jgi:hypothetical protein